MRRDQVDRLSRQLDGTGSGVHDRVTRRSVAAARSLRPAEPLSEHAYQRGLEAMFAEVDRTFQGESAGDCAVLSGDLDGAGWVVPAAARAATPDGLRVVTARMVEPLNDAALERITAEAAALVANQKHDRLGSR